MSTKYPMVFPPREVIDYFGGTAATHAILAGMGCRISKRAVSKWLDRGIVPPEAMLALTQHSLRSSEQSAVSFLKRFMT